MSDDPRHHDHASTSGGRPIQHQRQWRMRQTREDGTGKRQPDRFRRDIFVLDPAVKTRDQAFILPPADRRVVGNLGERDVVCANNATDHHGQRIQMRFLMAPRTRVQRLRQCPFDGTMVWKVMGMGRSCRFVWFTISNRIPCVWPFDSPDSDALSAQSAHSFCTVAKSMVSSE